MSNNNLNNFSFSGNEIREIVEKVFNNKNYDYAQQLVEYNYRHLEQLYNLKIFNSNISAGYKHIFNPINNTTLDYGIKGGSFFFTSNKIPTGEDFFKHIVSHKAMFQFLSENNVKMTLRDLNYKYFKSPYIISVKKSTKNSVKIDNNIIWIEIKDNTFNLFQNDFDYSTHIQHTDNEYLTLYNRISSYEFTEIAFIPFPYLEDLNNEMKRCLTSIIKEEYLENDKFESFFNGLSYVCISLYASRFEWKQYVLFPSSILLGFNNSSYTLFYKEEIDASEIHTTQNILNLELSTIAVCFYEKMLLVSRFKSAIAAIMSRNMSHNLGSHVFYYTRQNLLQIYETEKESNFPYTKEIKGLSWFLHYVQERQDFVANINSGDRYIFGPLNLKQDVIDEIAPDALDERHSINSNGDNKITKNYLLENIVKSEKISRNSKDNNALADIQIEIKYNNDNSKIFSTGSKQVDYEFYNLDLAVQGGQQSRHAFLIMLENIIRNSAKHAFNIEKNKNLTITIDVVEKDGQYYISIYDNTKNAENALSSLKGSLQNLKFIDDYNNSINRSNKGIKEILVSVMWLKGLDFGEIENHAKASDILKIENKYGNIAYSFSVPVFKKEESLRKEHIASILKDESLDIYASVFTVSNDEIRSYLESTISTIKEKTIFDELNKRIPHLILIDENRGNPKNLWKDLYDSKFGYNHDRSLLLFDRSKDSNHNSKVKFINSNDANDDLLKKSCIYFNNHLSKNKANLIQTMNNIKPSDDIIYESISGANQVFNLMQKFKNSSNYSTEDLYWNVLLNYNTKIIIVDERLAYSKSSLYNLEDDLKNFDQGKLDINGVFKRSGLKWEFSKFKNSISTSDDILKILNERYKTALNSESIKYQLPDDEKYAQYEYIPKISQDVYEKYKFQQNTFVFNLNSDDYVLTNSLDSKENIFLGYVDLKCGKFDIDFFTIHIGIIDKIKEKETGKSTREIIGSILNINKINTKYICVHSGRGGLNDKDDKINFIPFSILQRCFEDSKFLLSEFLYNNQYIPL